MTLRLLSIGHWLLCILSAAIIAGTVFWTYMSVLLYSSAPTSLFITVAFIFQLSLLTMPLSVIAALAGAIVIGCVRFFGLDTLWAYLSTGALISQGILFLWVWIGAIETFDLPGIEPDRLYEFIAPTLIAGLSSAWAFRSLLTGQIGWSCRQDQDDE